MILIYDKNEKIDLRDVAKAHFVFVMDTETMTFSITKNRKTGKTYGGLEFENFLHEFATASEFIANSELIAKRDYNE